MYYCMSFIINNNNDNNDISILLEMSRHRFNKNVRDTIKPEWVSRPGDAFVSAWSNVVQLTAVKTEPRRHWRVWLHLRGKDDRHQLETGHSASDVTVAGARALITSSSSSSSSFVAAAASEATDCSSKLAKHGQRHGRWCPHYMSTSPIS